MKRKLTDEQLTVLVFIRTLKRIGITFPIVALAGYAVYAIVLPSLGTALALILGLLSIAIMLLLIVEILG